MFDFFLTPFSWMSDNFRESNQEKKQRTNTINQAKKINSNYFTRGNREKSYREMNNWMAP